MTEDQIKHMVDRFLGWRLPQNFSPDAGISFKAAFNEHTAHPMQHEPSGTNLFDATQADAMVRYIIEGLPAASGDELAPARALDSAAPRDEQGLARESRKNPRTDAENFFNELNPHKKQGD